MLGLNQNENLLLQLFVNYALFFLLTNGNADATEECPPKCECFKSSDKSGIEKEVLEVLKRRNSPRNSVHITACHR